MSSQRPIYTQYPQLQSSLPFIELCQLPTPVEALALPESTASIWLKRDDISALPYGGNKIRKLEFLLADAQARGCRSVLTFGYAGSNFALATGVYAGRLGMQSISMLLPQLNAQYVQDNLRYGHASGITLRYQKNTALLAADAIAQTLRRTLRDGKKPYWIPAGGSEPRGVMGFINAALELKQQIDAGELPAPERIYCALGSMGTAAGLALGCAAAGLECEIHAARVVDEQYGSEKQLNKLIADSRKFLRKHGVRDPKLDKAEALIRVRNEFFGGAYGAQTPATKQALATANATGFELDGTYSGKAFAALQADIANTAVAPGKTLFWVTHNSQDCSEQFADVNWRDLPPKLQRYFIDPTQEI